MHIAAVCGLAATSVGAADVDAGKTLYGAKCRTCHGPTGSGNQAMAKALKVEIRDLASPEVQGKSDAELKKELVEGIGKMKPVPTLSAADQDNLVAFMRSLKK